MLEKDHDTLWSARDKVWFSTSFCELADIESLEAVDVFERRDSRCDCGFRDVFGQWKLNEDAMNCRIGIEIVDGSKQLAISSVLSIAYLLLRDGIGEDFVDKLNVGLIGSASKSRMRDYLLGSLSLHANIGARVWPIADLNDSKAWFKPGVAFLDFYNLALYLFPNGSTIRINTNGNILCNCGAVYFVGNHGK